jgi:hypothetical protein
MTPLEFISSLVESLTWPAALVVIAILFRAEIRRLLIRQLRRLRAGPVEFEFDRLLSQVEVELDQPDVPVASSDAARGRPIDSTLAELAVASPSSAVMEAHAAVEQALRDFVASVAPDEKIDRLGVAGLARKALELGLITPETANAIQGITVLRNLAAHGRAREVTADRALDYLALTDAVLLRSVRSRDEEARPRPELLPTVRVPTHAGGRRTAAIGSAPCDWYG